MYFISFRSLWIKGLQSCWSSNFLSMIRPRYNWNAGRLVRVGPGPRSKPFLRPLTLKASKFEALSSTDLIFTVLKDLNLLKSIQKNQEVSYNFRSGFAFSKWLHFQRAYKVTVCKRKLIAVCIGTSFIFFLKRNFYKTHWLLKIWNMKVSTSYKSSNGKIWNSMDVGGM